MCKKLFYIKGKHIYAIKPAGIAEEIKKALIIHPVSHVSEILKIVFNTHVPNKNIKQNTQKGNMQKVTKEIKSSYLAPLHSTNSMLIDNYLQLITYFV